MKSIAFHFTNDFLIFFSLKKSPKMKVLYNFKQLLILMKKYFKSENFQKLYIQTCWNIVDIEHNVTFY